MGCRSQPFLLALHNLSREDTTMPRRTRISVAHQFEPFGLDKEGHTVPVAAEKLRAFEGQMDLVMMKSAGR